MNSKGSTVRKKTGVRDVYRYLLSRINLMALRQQSSQLNTIAMGSSGPRTTIIKGFE
jgi:hypothetical protein